MDCRCKLVIIPSYTISSKKSEPTAEPIIWLDAVPVAKKVGVKLFGDYTDGIKGLKNLQEN